MRSSMTTDFDRGCDRQVRVAPHEGADMAPIEQASTDRRWDCA
jgi:hypothetical protein